MEERVKASPLEPPGLKVFLVLLYHVVAFKAAAVAHRLQDFHQANLTGERKRERERWRERWKVK